MQPAFLLLKSLSCLWTGERPLYPSDRVSEDDDFLCAGNRHAIWYPILMLNITDWAIERICPRDFLSCDTKILWTYKIRYRYLFTHGPIFLWGHLNAFLFYRTSLFISVQRAQLSSLSLQIIDCGGYQLRYTGRVVVYPTRRIPSLSNTGRSPFWPSASS